MKRKIEYQIRMVTRNYMNEITESYVMAIAYSKKVAELIKNTLEKQEMYKDLKETTFEIIQYPTF